MKNVSAYDLDLFEELPVPSTLLSFEGKVVTVNASALAFLQQIGLSQKALQPGALPETRLVSLQELEPFMSSEEQQALYDKRIEAPNGCQHVQMTVKKLAAGPEEGRLLVLFANMTECYAARDSLVELARGFSSEIGEAFMISLLQHLVKALHMDHAFICEYVDDTRTRVRTVAICVDGKPADFIEFDLAGTPCEHVVNKGLQVYPQGVRQIFPLDHLADAMGVESYFGIPLRDSQGQVLGPMALMSRRPVSDIESVVSMLQVFASRAASELERKQVSEAREEQVHFLQSLIDAIPNPIFFKDVQGRYLGCNETLKDTFGICREDLVGKTSFESCKPEWEELCRQEDDRVLRERTARAFETSLPLGDGRCRDMIIRKAPFFTRDGALGGLVGTVVDITEHKNAEQKIRKLAFYDTLTGLPNRILLTEEIAGLLASKNQQLGLLVLDLDQFKRINDTYGRMDGEEVLKEVAIRLQGCVRQEDTVARLGGDEFAVLLRGMVSRRDAETVVHKVLDSLAKPFVIETRELVISACIGVALGPEDGEVADVLLKNGDIALHMAKEKGRNSFLFYHGDMEQKALDRIRLENNLRRALRDDEFSLVYQPQFELHSGRLVGLEALVRWNHPRRGLILPGEFISMAEETGLIMALGEWVLRAACSQNKAWQEGGHPPMRVAVNLSAHQLKHPEFVDAVQRILEDTGLDPQYLELELTESMLMENAAHTIAVLERLRRMGVHLAIDDFGTGYSSLCYLQSFPVNHLKIAGSFLESKGRNRETDAIVEGIIKMGSDLNLRVIAEGVETVEQMELLRALNCHEVQGYYFAKPMAPVELCQMLSARCDGMVKKT